MHVEAVFLGRVVEAFERDEDVSEEERSPISEHEENELEDCNPRVSQRVRSWLSTASMLLRLSLELASPPSDPRRALQRSKDIVRGLVGADRSPGSFEDRRYHSTAENNNMLYDVLRNIGSLNDELVCVGLRSRHVCFERFMVDVNGSADDALFATECGFEEWARRGLRQRPCRSGALA